MSRLVILQQLYSRLSTLESDMEETRLKDQPTDHIYQEMKALRLKVKEVMNSPCPLLKEDSYGDKKD